MYRSRPSRPISRLRFAQRYRERWSASIKSSSGRGPTKARTEFAGPDIVVCTLEDSFTPAERRLAEMEEHQRLRDTRLYFQHATKGEFIGVIERILKRKVRAFNSSVDTHHDLSVEVFHLQPLTAENSADMPGGSDPRV